MGFLPRGGKGHGTLVQRNDLLAEALNRYQAFRPYAADYSVVQGRPMVAGDDRQLETYAPDETWSPNPGKATTELYNSGVSQPEQVQLVAGDMLHHLADVDPRWAQMKADVAPADMDKYRQDEFLMGYLTPDKADEWKNVYTPEQRQKLAKMADYLIRGSTAPGYR